MRSVQRYHFHKKQAYPPEKQEARAKVISFLCIAMLMTAHSLFCFINVVPSLLWWRGNCFPTRPNSAPQPATQLKVRLSHSHSFACFNKCTVA